MLGAAREVREEFGIEFDGESCLCGNALEFTNKASNGALWMGSYLQGFPFSVIRNHMTAMLALIEQNASRLRRKSVGGG